MSFGEMPRRPNVRVPELAFMLKRLLRWKNGASDETRAGTSLDILGGLRAFSGD